MTTNAVTIIGLLAASLTTTSLLPQLIKTWKLKETRDISMMMFIIMGVGLFLWMVYGFFISDRIIMAANSVSFAFVLVILFFKVKYG